MKPHFSIVLFIALIGSILASVTDTSTRTCNTGLLQNYGLYGLAVAKEFHLLMCPSVQYSCCQHVDQIQIYYNWIVSGKRDYIKNYYGDLTNDYGDLLEELDEVHRFSGKLSKVLKKTKVSNCKILSQVLMKFKTRSLIKRIRGNFHKMKNFLMKSYQGFYCSICNQENHQFFNTDNSTITLSSKFCRDIVDNSLPNMVFFYNDIVKYLNIVTRFLESCNYKGVYTSLEEIPSKVKFNPIKDDGKELDDCVAHRDHENWLAYCSPVCENFSLNRISLYFEPRRQEISEYVKYVKETMEKHRSMDGGCEDAKNARILQASSSPNPQSTQTKPKGPAVFNALNTTNINLDTYNITFADFGISLLDEGENSVITNQNYIEVKAILELEHNRGNSTSRSLRLVENGKSFFSRLFSFFH